MAFKKEKKEEGGVPEWMVTYGDMMTLLFCFFVILVSMSEIKDDEKFQRFKESIRRAFGYQGGSGYVTSNLSPKNTMSKDLIEVITRKFQKNLGKSKDKGIEGENHSVKKIRDGLEYTLGGQISFERGRAELLSPARAELARFADVIRGFNTKIRIRGHTSLISPGQYKPFASLSDLSYYRALAVQKFLVSKGIRSERITLEACGANEPLVARAYDEVSQAKNRRVSIIITEKLVKDFKQDNKSDGKKDDILVSG